MDEAINGSSVRFRRMQRMKQYFDPIYWLPGLVFVLAAVVLGYHAAPGVTFHDSGEFVMAAASAGIPHPPGAPSWTIPAWAFVHLFGFDDPARGTNLFCAMCGAMTLALMAWLVLRWSRKIEVGPKWVAAAGAIAAPLFLMHSEGFLEQCFITEQYTFMTMVLGLILIVATIMNEPGSDRRRLWLTVLLGWLWGVAICNHLSQMALGLTVALAILGVLPKENRRREAFRFGFAATVGLILGLLIFLWLPIRSMSNPLLDWGDPQTLKRFIWALTRQQWGSRSIFEAPPGWIAIFTRDWFSTYYPLENWGVTGVVALAAGAAVLAKRGRMKLAWLAAICIPYTLGMYWGHLKQDGINLTYIRQYGISDWHLPVYMAGALAGGVGVAWGLDWMRRNTRLAPAVAALVLAVAGIGGGRAIGRASLHDFKEPRMFIEDALRPMPDDAIVLVTNDNLSHMLTFWNWVRTPNPTRWVVYDLNTISAVMDRCVKKNAAWTRQRQVAHIKLMDLDPNEQPLRVRRPDHAELEKRPVYTEYKSKFPNSAAYLEPCGLLYRITCQPVSNDQARQAEKRWREKWPELLREFDESSPLRVREAWAILYGERAMYFMHRGMWPEAREYLERFIRIIPDNGFIWYTYGCVLDNTNQFKQAAEAYERAIEVMPILAGPRNNLGILLARAGVFERAEKLLDEEMHLSPSSNTAKNLALVRRSKGQKKTTG